MRGAYAKRRCKRCGREFPPRFPNQRVCKACWPRWRREYKQRYERKTRRELKMDYVEAGGDEA